MQYVTDLLVVRPDRDRACLPSAPALFTRPAICMSDDGDGLDLSHLPSPCELRRVDWQHARRASSSC